MKFGRLRVFGCSGKESGSHAYIMECICDCGTIKSVNLYSMEAGLTKSCGCLNRELTRERCTTHGMSHTSEWQILHQIKARCTNPKNSAYPRYGGRGIKVCQRWLDSYDDFLADVGKRPSRAHTLDRINNNGNYEPGNVRWATYAQQGANKRNVKLYDYRGEQLCLSEIARREGIPQPRLAYRIRAGYALEKALSQPRFGGEI